MVFAAIDSALKQREERLQAAQAEKEQQAQPGGGIRGDAAQQLKRAMSKPPLAAPLGNPIGAGKEQPPPPGRQQPAEQAAAGAKQANGGWKLRMQAIVPSKRSWLIVGRCKISADA